MNNQNNKINIFDVANYIIQKKSELNHLRLHKIIYYSHIQSLIKRKKPLIDERLEAWLYGPVFPILYNHIKENNNGFIVNPSKKGDFKKLNNEEKEIIDNIFNEIQKYKPFQISDITHQQKPWKDKFYQPTPNWEKEITNQELIDYFCKKKDLFEVD
ncbi:Panacea domain-containing protein [Candidatus Phytoplasma sp. AldY-WA1]|uniref:Panacea domain-containing protein n=1 Tax=Candidatus Phytoplasma sp. AldY-WA1 TaxID=2852100 RepID=UPI00254A64C1|nr:type II toxin-antitoxin system antitoxin SocA domain-containing protein [Candidatus Phytoplasma sp. AldY-WA1]